LCSTLEHMSSIFDNVDIATTRRKNKVLDTGQIRHIFGPNTGVMPGIPTAHGLPSSSAATQHPAYAPAEKPPEMNLPGNGSTHAPNTNYAQNMYAPHHNHMGHKFSAHDRLSLASVKIDIIWAVCVTCTLVPVFASVYSVTRASSFQPEMLTVPYQCNLFYFGLFCGLPGITVHIFCLSLIFHQLCRSGVILSLLSTFLMIVTVEHACMTTPSISTDNTFYLMALSMFFGLVAQALFVSILYDESNQKQFYIGTLGVAFVLVTLSILSIVLSMLNSETPHTKPTVLVRILPLSAAVGIYCLSTYWTLFPVRVVCNNM